MYKKKLFITSFHANAGFAKFSLALTLVHRLVVDHWLCLTVANSIKWMIELVLPKVNTILTVSLNIFNPPRDPKSLNFSPRSLAIIFLSKKTVNPSFSQKCSHEELVTRFPVQLWAASWAITAANDRSPAYEIQYKERNEIYNSLSEFKWSNICFSKF